MTRSSVRIGNGCGFWGDNLDAPILLVRAGRLDYLTLEYLAELTMSILALQKQRKPELGYAKDFLDVLERLVPILRDQPDLKIVTNAGGMNPPACAERAREILDSAGLDDRKIGVVHGDDLMPAIDSLTANGHSLDNLDSGANLDTVRERIVSANAYLGSEPIVEALQRGASIVITGRVADASLTVAPAVHELGWGWDDADLLSAATVAGHLIECGAQVTGGLWINHQETDLTHVGYPIAEIEPNGSFVITKPEGSGGAVNTETVAEQLLYEVGDPRRYLTPDVVADFTSVTLTEAEPNVVRVTGAKGQPATDAYKISLAYRDGYSASGSLVLAGPDAVGKAKLCAEILLDRLERAGAKPEQHLLECLGAGDCVPGVRHEPNPPEVVMRLAVRDPSRDVVARFTREFAPLVTSGPPGVTGYAVSRSAVREVFAYWPTLIAKDAVTPKVDLL